MSKVTRVEVFNLLRKAEQQAKQAKELQEQLEDLAARIEKDGVDSPKSTTTRRKIPK
jgi:hypothetical protein